jgi:glycosyltransferase involved in cell wall biosynthesis
MVWLRLAEKGAVQCRALAGSADTLKGTAVDSMEAGFPGIEVRRHRGSLIQKMPSEELIAWAAEHQPDIIVSSDLMAPIGQRLHALTGAPLVLHTENWFDSRYLGRRQSLGIPWLRPLANKLRMHRLERGVSRVMIASPEEVATIAAHGDRYAFVPWPHPPVSSVATAVTPFRDRVREVVTIGSIARWKGADQLRRYIPHLLAHDPTIRVRIIGPALDRSARDFLDSLAPWADRCSVVRHLPRKEALAVMGNALCVFCPTDKRGWGAIGDAWNMGTPIVGISEHYRLERDVNALVAETPDELVHAIRRLRDDEALWNRLVQAGGSCVRSAHSVDTVAAAVLRVLRSALDDAQASRRAGAASKTVSHVRPSA